MNVDHTKKIIGEYSFLLRDKLGSGSSSEVFRGISLKTSEAVAVKVISLGGGSREAVAESAACEIEMLKKLKFSGNIIQLKSAVQTKNNLYIVTELCETGTLEAQLARGRLDQETAVAVMGQVIEGCRDLVRAGVVHRDLKPSNIFRKGAQYKVGDLGYAMPVEECSQPQTENVGSPSYMPLESLQLNQYSHQGDIWALGVIFFQLLTGRTPWKARTERDLLKQIENFRITPLLPKLATPSSRLFLERTLEVDRSSRMTVEELMEWSFSSAREQTVSMGRLKSLRSTLDLLALPDLKAVVANRSMANLQPPKLAPSPAHSQQNLTAGEQRCFKVKQTESPVDLKKSKRTAGTMNTIDSNDNIPSPTKSPEKSPARPKEQRSSSPIPAKPSAAPVLRAKTESFLEVEKLSGGGSLPEPFEGLASQVGAQVNYARFLLRVLRKLNDSLRTKDTRVLELKQSLLFFLYVKLAEVKDLRHARSAPAHRQAFLASPHYASVTALLAKYRERARQEGAKLGLGLISRTEKEFLSTLGGAMGYLYSHLAPLRNDLAELERRRAVVAILEDLMALSELFMLEREEDWSKFRDASGIATQLAKTLPDTLTPDYIHAVEARFLRLAHS